MEMKKRQFNRMNTSLPMEFRVEHGESLKSSSGMGVLRNMSLGGIYFTCKTLFPIKANNIYEFDFATNPLGLSSPEANLLSVQGLVVRIEQLGLEAAPFGVAVKFLQVLG